MLCKLGETLSNRNVLCSDEKIVKRRILVHFEHCPALDRVGRVGAELFHRNDGTIQALNEKIPLHLSVGPREALVQ